VTSTVAPAGTATVVARKTITRLAAASPVAINPAGMATVMGSGEGLRRDTVNCSRPLPLASTTIFRPSTAAANGVGAGGMGASARTVQAPRASSSVAWRKWRAAFTDDNVTLSDSIR
jgi:hypothetical protein